MGIEYRMRFFCDACQKGAWTEIEMHQVYGPSGELPVVPEGWTTSKSFGWRGKAFCSNECVQVFKEQVRKSWAEGFESEFARAFLFETKEEP